MRALTARSRLPWRRRCRTVSARIMGLSVHLSVGEYPDGRPGEVFVTTAKVGSFTRGILDEWSVNTSIALQYGVPLSSIIAAGLGREFPPAGDVSGHPTITSCTSLTDFVVRALADLYPALAAEGRA